MTKNRGNIINNISETRLSPSFNLKLPRNVINTCVYAASWPWIVLPVEAEHV